MASNFRIPYDELPRRLYRVHCPSYSVTSYSPQRGFQSRDSSGNDFHKVSAFLSAIREHLNWSSTKSSPFISAFSRKSHALGWARKWLKRHPDVETVQVMEIDPTKVTAVINVKDVVDKMPKETILPSSRNERQVEDEFLCMYQVPDWAIVDVEEIDRERNTVHAWNWENSVSVVNIIDVDLDVEMGGMDSQPLVEYVPGIPSNANLWGYSTQAYEPECNHAQSNGNYQEHNQWSGYHGGDWGAARHGIEWPSEEWRGNQLASPLRAPKIKYDNRQSKRRRR